MKTKVNAKMVPILFLAILVVLMVLPMSATAETLDGPALARHLDEVNLHTLSQIAESTTQEPDTFWNFRTATYDEGVWTTYHGVQIGWDIPIRRFEYDNGIDVLWLYGLTHQIIFYGDNSVIILSWGPAANFICWQNVYHTPE